MKKSFRSFCFKIFISCLAVLALLIFSGCGEDSNKVTTPQLTGVHPDGWMVRISSNFHGRAALLSIGRNCADCHGADWNGGTSGVSCISCHSQRDNKCITCHGGLDNMLGSPPYGLHDEVSDTAIGIGAHTAHVVGTGIGAKVSCQACHITPLFVLDSAHLDYSFTSRRGFIDSVAEVTWGGMADGGNASWDRIDRNCSGTYCHGNFAGGNANNMPIWTASGQAACGSCHDVGSNPRLLGGEHRKHIVEKNIDCVECHSVTTDAQLRIIRPAIHVDGQVQVVFEAGGTYSNGTCTPSCHGTRDWFGGD